MKMLQLERSLLPEAGFFRCESSQQRLCVFCKQRALFSGQQFAVASPMLRLAKGGCAAIALFETSRTQHEQLVAIPNNMDGLEDRMFAARLSAVNPLGLIDLNDS